MLSKIAQLVKGYRSDSVAAGHLTRFRGTPDTIPRL